ncbi:MAG: hypothetical protein QXS37_05615 [Candidatus Aenigmatarchaeota archaeon]
MFFEEIMDRSSEKGEDTFRDIYFDLVPVFFLKGVDERGRDDISNGDGVIFRFFSFFDQSVIEDDRKI